jgi:hypothetical protein
MACLEGGMGKRPELHVKVDLVVWFSMSWLTTPFSKRLPTHPYVHTGVKSAKENHDNEGNNERCHWAPLALIHGESGTRKPVMTVMMPLSSVYD